MARSLTMSDIVRYQRMLAELSEAYADYVMALYEPDATGDTLEDWPKIIAAMQTVLSGVQTDAQALGMEFMIEAFDALGVTGFTPEYTLNNVFDPSKLEPQSFETVEALKDYIDSQLSSQVINDANNIVRSNVNAAAKQNGVNMGNHTQRRTDPVSVRNGANVRYAMVPQGDDPCAFCKMIASRGFIYYENRSHENHAECKCVAVPGDRDTTIEGYDLKTYQSQYDKARELAGSTNKYKVAAAMRSLGFASH